MRWQSLAAETAADAGDDSKFAGKRPSYFTKKNVGTAAVRLCKDIIDDAWSDPAFLKEQRLVCGNDKQWVFTHKRGNKTVAGHCRNVAARRPRTKKTKSQLCELSD